jgi:ATP-dependent protease HslVU (ClpYQ) peptidase subunit
METGLRDRAAATRACTRTATGSGEKFAAAAAAALFLVTGLPPPAEEALLLLVLLLPLG